MCITLFLMFLKLLTFNQFCNSTIFLKALTKVTVIKMQLNGKNFIVTSIFYY